MTQKTYTYAFEGGLDTNSAALAVSPGRVIAATNYEPLAEGYGRVQGYERCDGRTAPSAIGFATLGFDAGHVAIHQNDVVLGATSGATGKVILEPIAPTGSWGAGTAAGLLVLINVAGTFVDNETLKVGATNCAIVNGILAVDSGPDAATIREWTLDAMAYQRGLIAKVPGEGSVNGVAVHLGVLYAWRNNVGSTRNVCWRATAAGWVQLPRLFRLPFTIGALALAAGDVLTGATSGGTARVLDTFIDTGTVGAGDAAGYVVLADYSGSIANGETVNRSGTFALRAGSIAGCDLGPGGKTRTFSYNFYGASNRFRLYGANGTGHAFELWPGEGCVTIVTGMVVDTPTHPFQIGNHLGLCFPGGSVQISATLQPREFKVILGAGEIGFGSDVTDVVSSNDTAVAIFGEQKIGVLQGTDTASFALDILTEEAGADADSAQRMGQTIHLDKRGLRSLSATQNFGNFSTGTLSGLFEKYFRAKRKAGAKVIGTVVSRLKSQFRLYWDDRTGITVYVTSSQPQYQGQTAQIGTSAIPFDFSALPAVCFGQGEMADGEGLFAGGSDGYVYRLDSGNNFDGSPIEGFCMTGFNNFKTPEQDWRYHKVVLELQCPPAANIAISAQYDYADGQNPDSSETDFTVQGGGGFWNSALWNQFYWSQPVEGRAEAPIDGIGANASFIFATTADLDEEAHVLQAYKVWRSPRKQKR